ncbi:MAG TPA: hypothetical protein VGL86_05330 [Polyangia bacterium]
MAQPEEIVESPGYALCTVGRVVVLVWKQPPAAAGVAETRHRLRMMRERAPSEKMAFLTVIEPAGTALNVPTEVRDALSAMLKELQKQIAAAAVVVDAEGFRASLVRTFVATMNLGNRLEFPSNTERHVIAAARWLAARDPALAIDANDLAQAVATLRARWAPATAARARL